MIHAPTTQITTTTTTTIDDTDATVEMTRYLE